MTTTTRVFEPNSVLIPEAAVWHNSQGAHADPDMCTLLFLDGDSNGGKLYTKDQWENPDTLDTAEFVLHVDGIFYRHDTGNAFCPSGLSIRDQRPVEGDHIALLPDMYVVKVDETWAWESAVLTDHHVKRVFTVYVFNRRKVVHLAEITGSYERRFMSHQFEPGWPSDAPNYDALNERAFEMIMREGAGEEDVSYVHCSDMEKALKTVLKPHAGDLPDGVAGGYRWNGLKAVTEEDAIEEIREATCNGDL